MTQSPPRVQSVLVARLLVTYNTVMSHKIGVNDLCPCGSKKKYKKCYMTDSENCSLYIKENATVINAKYDKITKVVIESLLRTTQDLTNLFYKTPDDMEIVPPLMQLIGTFTVIDVLANYWYQYLGITGKPSERFNEYVNNFVFTNDNQEFSQRKYLQNISSEDLGDLRNNVVHFYGLGASHKFCIIPNLSKISSSDEIDRMIKSFKKINKNLIFIQPFEFKKIITESAIVMLQRFQSDGSLAKNDKDRILYCHNVERIYQKLQNEGAAVVTKEMAQKISNILLK